MIIAGIDEVGRGAIAGPMIFGLAAFDISNDWWQKKDIITLDSKFYSAKKRLELFEEILRNVIWADVCIIGAQEIDEIGLSESTCKAISSLLLSYNAKPLDLLIIDGNKSMVSSNCYLSSTLYMPKADQKIKIVGAASIIAKIYRDTLLNFYSIRRPTYGWDRNVGYCTAHHIHAIKHYGLTDLHRKSYYIRGVSNVL